MSVKKNKKDLPKESKWFDELPGEVKKSIQKGLDDAKNGKVTPHSEVRKKYQKYYPGS